MAGLGQIGVGLFNGITAHHWVTCVILCVFGSLAVLIPEKRNGS